MKFKKIIVKHYDKDGNLKFTETMTTRNAVEAVDSKEAKSKVSEIVSRNILGSNRYTVEWKGEYGDPEGYMVVK